jgi:hypothetical protein
MGQFKEIDKLPPGDDQQLLYGHRAAPQRSGRAMRRLTGLTATDTKGDVKHVRLVTRDHIDFGRVWSSSCRP